MLICNKCGKTGKRGRFCVYCGGELSEFFTIKTSEEKTPAGECPECGKEYFGGNFCVFCGTPLAADSSPTENESVSVAAEAVGETADVPEEVEEDAAELADVPEAIEEAAAELADIPEKVDEPTEADEPVKLKCAECGKIMYTGKFCTSCGGALQPVTTEPVHADAADNSNAAAPAKEENVVSVKMLEPVSGVPVQLRCEQCGNIMNKGKFCTVCGGSLKPVGGEPEQQARLVSAAIPAPINTPPAANAPVMLQCEQCGKNMDRGKFCTSCGGNLKPVGGVPDVKPAQPVPLPMPTPQPVPVPQPAPIPMPIPQPVPTPAPQTAPAPTAQAVGLVCPTCGKKFERGKFCTVCGSGLVQRTASTAGDSMLHCVQCGKTFEKGKFCTSCGGHLVTSDKMNV